MFFLIWTVKEKWADQEENADKSTLYILLYTVLNNNS